MNCDSLYMDNIQKSLQKYTKQDRIDAIMFPEMAFTAYGFESKEKIQPYLEISTKGQIFEFLSNEAKRVGCYVIAGYAEKYIDDEQKEHLYNSCYIVNRDGTLLLNYRKSFLYETDKIWCEEGQGFKAIEMVNCDGIYFKAAIGICMDINPYEFGDSSLFEFGNFCKDQEVDVIFFVSAWTDSEPKKNDKSSIEGLINYWLWRLYPIVNRKNDKRYPKSVLFLAADRVGEEINVCKETSQFSKDEITVFAGCSCCIKLNPVELVYNFDKRTQGVLKTECTLETLA